MNYSGLIYKDELLRQSHQLKLFEKGDLEANKRLIESLRARQPDRLNVNLKNIIEEQCIKTGIHQGYSGNTFEVNTLEYAVKLIKEKYNTW